MFEPSLGIILIRFYSISSFDLKYSSLPGWLALVDYRNKHGKKTYRMTDVRNPNFGFFLVCAVSSRML